MTDVPLLSVQLRYIREDCCGIANRWRTAIGEIRAPPLAILIPVCSIPAAAAAAAAADAC